MAVVMSTAIDRAAQEGSLYDATTYTPYILETNSQLWYGDVDSVQERIRWSVSEGLQGIGFWALQYENGVDGFWEMVQSETVLSIDPEEPEETEDTGSPQDDENQAPTADAGDDFTSVLGEDFTLDGSASSDPEAVPLTYRWEQLHGPEASIQFPNQSQTTVSVRDEGTYVFKLHVSDGALSDTDQVLAVVQSAPKGGCNTSNSPTWLFTIGLLSLFRRKNTLREI
ncbi:MAG: PKD domain-containing protein [Myxococcota bacterium]|nr:PKD domain-containing protein [Myxococcota bacterium]